ncbi:Putative E3 ubiquitinprotein ligase MYCBP2like [Caligus rogercresseyi]|uniref:E3 ubiquitinprotein ligase MYCBP2like n=1 Tax=Caligus rogercresseyi TaxID=217165 RepID=A0A7T8GV98_CALRO|nr:Putative E3 ubiquitinprotein ligase MYCBP2like [Caligus rogercresseyi]
MSARYFAHGYTVWKGDGCRWEGDVHLTQTLLLLLLLFGLLIITKVGVTTATMIAAAHNMTLGECASNDFLTVIRGLASNPTTTLE